MEVQVTNRWRLINYHQSIYSMAVQCIVENWHFMLINGPTIDMIHVYLVK